MKPIAPLSQYFNETTTCSMLALQECSVLHFVFSNAKAKVLFCLSFLLYRRHSYHSWMVRNIDLQTDQIVSISQLLERNWVIRTGHLMTKE